MNFTKAFNIPQNLKHDHELTEHSIAEMEKGIGVLKVILDGSHNQCMEYVIKYSELNILYFFAANLLTDKDPLRQQLASYIENITGLFNK